MSFYCWDDLGLLLDTDIFGFAEAWCFVPCEPDLCCSVTACGDTFVSDFSDMEAADYFGLSPRE